MKPTPIWLRKDTALAVHEAMLQRYGGGAGVRDMALLESALARPQNLFIYEQADLWALAASYAFGIANNHPFIDGNKRTAFMAAYTFLADNGLQLIASEADAAVMTLGLADKSVAEVGYTRWLRDNTQPRKVAGSEGSP